MKTLAEIISIGDELLIGQVINTNAAWIARELNLSGISVYQVSVVSDSREHILKALEDAHKRVGIILITGGLGPTKDDITKHVLCEYFNTSLVFDENSYRMVESIFLQRGLKVTGINRSQAEIPANCRPIDNHHGTAPGMWFKKEGRVYISMPGVPFEMKPMMSNYVLPELQKLYTEGAIYHKTILTQGMGESFLSVKIANWEDKLPANIKLAYLPQPGIVRLRLTGKGDNYENLRHQVEEEVSQLVDIIPQLIYGYDDDTLELICGNLLKQRNQTISTAESCTGGYIAHRITSIPGSSGWFRGSIIAYANDVKVSGLGVDPLAIEQYGAVSETVVKQMVAGVKERLKTDWAIAITGIAGPDGGSEEKPVGTSWIAVSGPHGTITRHCLFGEHRERNIVKAGIEALNMLRKEILSWNG